ncbi:MAG: ABC transporter substrate-binding protein [Bifidobacteriaceae bacterium]|jgi:multiple sugar transport system substrate-binding protein|nr:ABC transporter substrate-binding protein [Bifidobacteriaceae bacterium]
MTQTHLKGITWNHSRGYTSIVGVSQRYSELHSDVDIEWEKRSLTDFESAPIGELASQYDLLIIDHPWAGFAARHHVLLPLQDLLSHDFLADQCAHSVGASFDSYNFGGFQSALAIDAASPVAVWRPDLLDSHDVPASFDEVLELAKEGGVAYAATPQYLLMDFYAFCNTAGGNLFPRHAETGLSSGSASRTQPPAPAERAAAFSATGGPGAADMPDTPDTVVDRNVGVQVLEDMRRLASLCPADIFRWNPIQLHEELATSSELRYCPFVYGYVNYSRRGYAAHRLRAGAIPKYQGKMLTGVLGGTGLAISAGTKSPEIAADFVQFALSRRVQTTLYTDCGGQPGYRDAWVDAVNNAATLDFFDGTLTTLDNTWMRPRYSGYLYFQDRAGVPIRDYVRDGGDPEQVLDALDALYRESKEFGARDGAGTSSQQAK